MLPRPLHTFSADRGDDRRRVDEVVMRHLAGVDGISRTRVQRWIAGGRIRVEEKPARRAAQRVLLGQRVDVLVDLPASVPRSMVAQPLPLSILFEDEDLLALNKPAGLVVHPSSGHRDGTLMNALINYASGWTSGRPSLVHRLDKHTSGVLLVAKSSRSHALLVRALARPDARKEYLALCYGRMRVARRRLRHPLGRSPFDRRRVVVRDDGREAVTEVVRLAESRGAARGLTLLQCRLVTGRMHQIRVHLQAESLPIVGDPVYGGPGWRRIRDLALAEDLRTFSHQALHARRLTFTHPVSAASIVIEAPPPADMTRLLERAGLVTSLDADNHSCRPDYVSGVCGQDASRS
jgi:23S rRNA pseudouridine1911/1915/1917 synthase